jgi:hypothetical protein
MVDHHFPQMAKVGNIPHILRRPRWIFSPVGLKTRPDMAEREKIYMVHLKPLTLE